MSRLGSIFEDDAEHEGTERGPDLRVQAQVSRSALGAAEGVRIDVPSVIDGQARVVHPSDPSPEHVTVRLPENLPDGATLRLRGQGGAPASGRPGDLYLTIQLVDAPLARMDGARTGFALSPTATVIGLVVAGMVVLLALRMCA